MNHHEVSASFFFLLSRLFIKKIKFSSEIVTVFTIIRDHSESTCAIRTTHFDPPPLLYTPVRFEVALPHPAHVLTFDTEYYPLSITQSQKTLKTSNFLESF